MQPWLAGSPILSFVICSVNVDESLVVFAFAGSSPSSQRIRVMTRSSSRSIFFVAFTGRRLLNTVPIAHSIANFLRDAEPACRRFDAPLLRAESKSRSGNRVSRQLLPPRFQR